MCIYIYIYIYGMKPQVEFFFILRDKTKFENWRDQDIETRKLFSSIIFTIFGIGGCGVWSQALSFSIEGSVICMVWHILIGITVSVRLIFFGWMGETDTWLMSKN